MGSAFEFVLVADEHRGESLLNDCVEEVKRIEYLLTEFSETSQTALLNRSAGKVAVTVDAEVYALISRCKQLSKLAQGAFDITSGILKKLYKFKSESFPFPDDNLIKEKLRLVGYDKIELLSSNRIYLKSLGMHVGFGGIGKGYAADRVRNLMITQGVTSGVINASGDLTAWGNREDGSPWKVGIADPQNPSSALVWLPIRDCSVATSGDYEQYFERNGERYSHTIDPKTGKPVKGTKSVTVISPSAELSDAMATAVFTMGTEVGLHFIEQLPHTHAIIVNHRNEISMTSHLKPDFNEAII